VAALDPRPGIWPGKPFGDLTVVRTDAALRGGHCPSNPSGWPAVECECSCGRAGLIIPRYRLTGGNTTSCGHGKCTMPRANPDRARILAWLAEHGPTRVNTLAEGLGMTTGAAGGQVTLMLRAGQIERPFRGVVCLPGCAPEEEPPAHPGRSAGNAKSARTRWENMTQAERDKRVAVLAAGRREAAARRG